MCATVLCGFTVPNPSQQFLVDQTGQMGTQVEEALETWNRAFASSGAQIAVAVIPSLNGEDLETSATDTFRAWGVGNKRENNGVLIFIALEDRQIRVEVGYGLEEVLPDGLVGRMMREYVYPAFQQKRYREGTIALIDALGNKMGEKYEVRTDRPAPDRSYRESEGAGSVLFKLLALFILLAGAFGTSVARFYRGRGRRPQNSGLLWYFLWCIFQELFRNGGGRGGSGGWGGRSGGGFGGGSSGGGGASGRW